MTGGKPKLYGDFRTLLESNDIDAVVIATPDHWHCLMMVAACEAGKDVYVEKPLANSIQECDLMLRAADKYGRVVQVGQPLVDVPSEFGYVWTFRFSRQTCPNAAEPKPLISKSYLSSVVASLIWWTAGWKNWR